MAIHSMVKLRAGSRGGLCLGGSKMDACSRCGHEDHALTARSVAWINGHAVLFKGFGLDGADDVVVGLIEGITEWSEETHDRASLVSVSLYFCQDCLLEMVRRLYAEEDGVAISVGTIRKGKKRPGGKAWHAIRFRILERDRFTCQYCGQRAPDVTLHIDHKTAVADGGSDELDNLTTACSSCNIGKEGVRKWRRDG